MFKINFKCNTRTMKGTKISTEKQQQKKGDTFPLL